MRLFLFVLGAVAALSLVRVPAFAEQPKYDTGAIPDPHIVLPDGNISAMVFLFSDSKGWSAADDRRVSALTGEGAAVVGIDYPSYIASLAKDDGDCIYTISDIESLSQQIQRAAGNSAYRTPILAGEGDAATLVLAMIAQSPFATIGQAIAVNPNSVVPVKKVLCTPASKVPSGNGVIYGLTDGPLPAPVTIVETNGISPAGKAHVDALVKDHPDIAVQNVDSSDQDNLLTDTLNNQIEASAANTNPLGLPLTELEAKPVMDTMAVIYSGDGGWRDIDMELGLYLQKQGVPTIGLDSLRYFWTKQSPEQTASDLARIIETYRKKWKVKNVVLVGYSFGADVLPSAFDRLTTQQKSSVKQMSLLALSKSVDYEISISGWLGAQGSFEGGKTADAVSKIDPRLVQCLYGTDDSDESACPGLKNKGYDVIEMPGGHHFDDDYDKVGEVILNGLRKRLSDG